MTYKKKIEFLDKLIGEYNEILGMHDDEEIKKNKILKEFKKNERYLSAIKRDIKKLAELEKKRCA